MNFKLVEYLLYVNPLKERKYQCHFKPCSTDITNTYASHGRARDLVAKDLNGYSDPYCVVKVNGEVKYRTRVKKKTLNPEWEETLMTHLPKHPDHLSIVSPAWKDLLLGCGQNYHFISLCTH